MTFEQLTKAGMNDTAAGKLTNTIFGGENKTLVAQAGWVSGLSRTGFFAPDWWASQFKMLGLAAGKGMPEEIAKARQIILTRVMAGALIHEGLNWALTGGPNDGHFSWDNAPRHEMDVETKAFKRTSDKGEPQRNYFDGRILYDPRDYDLLKTGAVMVRTRSLDPLGRFVGNRLSIPLSQAASQAAGPSTPVWAPMNRPSSRRALHPTRHSWRAPLRWPASSLLQAPQPLLSRTRLRRP
jgi:hypothetical protein